MSQFFSPRPEAQATNWDELMPPVKMAVRDLLVRIHGAHHSVRSQNADKTTSTTGSCFLVYGSRGTGKTSVLLNAQKAVCKKSGEKFFEKNSEKEDQSEKQAKIQAIKDAKELRDDGIVWLEILNLEPIPDKANLLTILLTQVRNALHTHCDKIKRDQRSIFEENTDSAQQQLSKLINDATLMWENINEPDTRTTSSFQVKAADAYAAFPEKFKKAMDKLIDELSEVRCSDSKVSIVLPIDNIDRSTEHLQSIVKLAQLVTHPNLWLVMAGDREEVQTFLERAYWKELIRSSDGAGARGKIDSDGEDEALVMARRQANTTAQKLWPANHRVEIDLLTPEQTLDFTYKSAVAVKRGLLEHCDGHEEFIQYHNNPNSANAEKTTKATIRKLLEQIRIPTTNEQRITSNKGKKSSVKLLDLFDVSENIGKHRDDEPYLTRTAKHGLSLPARSVIELWQLLAWLTVEEDTVENSNSEKNTKDFKAEKIARTMLRNAISSSNLSSGIAQNLQTDILCRSEEGGTILNFFNRKLNGYILDVIYMSTSNNDFEFPLSAIVSRQSPSILRSQLIINEIKDVTLFLRQEKTQEKTQEKIEELDSLAAAWLMILYDILILAEEDTSWVINVTDTEWLNVSVHHEVKLDGKSKKRKVELNWNAPDWQLFLGRNIFRLRWMNFRRELADSHLQEPTLVPRLLAVGWILCVLETSVELINSIDAKLKVHDECGNKAFTDALLNSAEKNLENLTDEQLKKFANKYLPRFTEENLEKLALERVSVSTPEPTEEEKERLKKLTKEDLLKLTVSDLLELSEAGRDDLTQTLEQDLMKFATAFYDWIQEKRKSPFIVDGNNKEISIIPAAYEVMLETEKWLETELIYFLSHVYVPLKSAEESNERFDAMLNALKELSALKKHWQDNLPFILDELEERLEKAESESQDEKSKDKNTELEARLTNLENKCNQQTTVSGNDDKTKTLGELLAYDLYQL